MYSRTYNGLTWEICRELRTALVDKLQHLSIHYHTETQSGRLISKVMRDAENVEQMLNTAFHGLVMLVGGVVVTVTVTAIKSPSVLWLYLMVVPMVTVTARAFKLPIQSSNRELRGEVERLQGTITEMLEMIPITRAYGLNDRESRRAHGLLKAVTDSGLKVDVTNTVFGATSWVVFQLTQLLCLAYTGLLAWHGRITVGEVVLYQNYLGQIVSSVSGIVNLFPLLAKGSESLHSVNEILLSEDMERTGGTKAPDPLQGELRLEKVSYCYGPNTPPVLDGVDLQIPAGSSLAIVGGSGAGKTTILNLLLGFADPMQGRIMVDGIDLRELDLASYRRQIAVVPQNTLLFSGTLRDNIAYAAPEADDAELMELIEKLELAEVVRALPGGMEANLAEHGDNLSGGQRQRISIARALLRHPRLLILDEATSALDSETEQQVLRTMREMMGHCTMVLVAHRLSTIQEADCIVVLEEGHIVEQGNYEALMAQKGRFYQMKRLQK